MLLWNYKVCKPYREMVLQAKGLPANPMIWFRPQESTQWEKTDSWMTSSSELHMHSEALTCPHTGINEYENMVNKIAKKIKPRKTCCAF